MSPLAQGVLLGAGAALAQGISYTLQAREARRVQTSRPGRDLLRRMAARPLWLSAIGLTAVAFLLQVLALRQVPLAVVQPMFSLSMLVLLATGSRLLGERVGRREIGSVALILAGLAAVVAGAPPHTAHVSENILRLTPYPLLALVLAAPYARRSKSSWTLVAGAAAGDVLAALSTNRLSAQIDTKPGLGVLWLGISAIAGLSAITSETAALQRLPATRVAPIVMGADVTLPVAISALDTHVRWSATPGGGALLAGGVVLVGLGSILLGGSRAVAGVRGQAIAAE